MGWICVTLIMALTTTSSFGRRSNQRQRVSGSRGAFDPTPYIRAECHRLGYCENVANYPRKYVDSLLAAFPDKVVPVGVDLDEELEYTQVYRPEDNEVPLCKSTSEVITPDAVRTKSGKWVYVARSDRLNLQANYKVIKCTEPNTQCDNIAVFPNGYSSACRQGYIQRLTNVLDHDGQLRVTDFQIPGCCSCSAISG